MSGIWGFTCNNSTANLKRVHSLEFWTRCYGPDGSDRKEVSSGVIGCHIEHLSDDYPSSDKVLQSGPYSAVIDVIIYNREETARIINLTNWQRYSDEELLFRLWLEKGYQAFASVNGDFTGAVHDERDDSWTLFRDHLGIRPLFYYIDDQQFAFSTDMRGLTALPGVDLKLNEVMFYQDAAGYNALSLCDTEYANIHCVRPASQMTVIPSSSMTLSDPSGTEGISVPKSENPFVMKNDVYWKLGLKKILFNDPEQYAKELRRLITDSVERRLSAVSGLIGAELSGGLDSCIIDILINRCHREAVYYSWSYDPAEYPLQEGRDERDIILDLCKQENITCHFTNMPTMESVTEIRDMLKHIDPPYMNTPQLAAGSGWMHSQGARVVFTGHGGDEGVSHRANLYELWCHGEYYHYFKALYRGTTGYPPRFLRTLVHAYRELSVSRKNLTGEFRSSSAGIAVLNKEFTERVSRIAPHLPLPFAYDPVAYTLQGGPQVRLNNAAFQGAENGVRYMFPFLDYRVFDYAVSIPRWQFNCGEGNRAVYRKAFDDLMPDSLRRMHYKDTPSMNNFHIPDMDYSREFLKSKQQMIEFLDWDFWEQYLDRAEVEAIMPAENVNSPEYIYASVKMNVLLKCCMIQNTMKNTEKTM